MNPNRSLQQARVVAIEQQTGHKSPGPCAECGLPVEPLTASYPSGRFFCGPCQLARRLGNRDREGEA